MKNIIQITFIFALAIGVFSIAPQVFAWGTGDYGNGCCDGGGGGNGSVSPIFTYSQSSYYSQSAYAKPAVCNAFTGTPTTLAHGGGNVTLKWTTTNATSVSINGGVGTVSADGSKVVSVTKTTTFTLTAKGTAGNDTCTTKVTVNPPVYNQSSYYSQSAYAVAASCDFLKANGQQTELSLPYGGGDVNLSWATTNAQTVSLNQDLGTVSANGSKSVTVNATKTFVLTAASTAGSKTCAVKVTVQPQTYSQGSYNTYSQGSYNTYSQGSYNNYSQGSYNNYSQGSYSNYSQGSYGGGGSSSPKCDFNISEKKIKKGEEIKLTWNTTRATQVVIKDSHGKTLLDTDDLDSDDRKDFYDGDLKIKPSKDTTYTLIASKGSKDRTCKVSVDVENEITVLEVRDQKPLVGIKLVEVPYTGFEAGPMLTFMFYGLLALWGLFLAYTLVLKKKVS